jgi:hypothetical protein
MDLGSGWLVERAKQARKIKRQASSFKLQAARPGGPSKIVKKRFDVYPGYDRMSLERKKTYEYK